jgi:TPR repeat protein
LGLAYQEGIGVPKDMSLARFWMEEAAKKGHQDAMDVCRKRGW